MTDVKNREKYLKHFSHQHPLVFIEQQSDGNEGARCSGCKEPVIGPAYCCTSCEFYLDKRCAELPRTIHNPLHLQHPLTLLAKSPYPNGIYECRMCKNHREGFLYHCSDDDFDLDSNCAFSPKLKSKFDFSGDEKFISEDRLLEWYLFWSENRDPEFIRLKALVEGEHSREEGKHMHEETDKINTVRGEKSSSKEICEEYFDPYEETKYGGETNKLDSIQGKQPSILDFLMEDFRSPSPSQEKYLISKEEKIYQGETGKLDIFGGKRSEVKPYKGKDIVKKETIQQGETEKSSCNSPSPSVFRTPPKLEFQKPELVSIGPYHRDEEHELDTYKHSFLEKHLSRASNNPERDLSFYVGEIIALEKRARAYYWDADFVMPTCDFVKMMLVDGCFIIELLRHFGGSEDDLSPENPINIIMPWQIPILVQDLLLLENQIPFFVLEKLFDLSKNHEGKPEVSLTIMALKFFDVAFPRSSDFISEFSLLEADHLLDLFVKTIRPSNPFRPTNRGNWRNISHSFFKTLDFFIQMRISDLQDLIVEAINSATTPTSREETENHPSSTLSKPSASSRQYRVLKIQRLYRVLKMQSKRAKRLQQNRPPILLLKTVAELRQAGIEFMPSRLNSFLDVNFKDGVIEIPIVTINNLFSTLLVNSIALENCRYYNRRKHVTDYIYFMSSLIKDANDVKLLCSKGIISRFSDNDKKVTDLFNLLRSYALIDMSNSHLLKTIRAIESYNGQSRKPMRQFLMETSVVLIMFSAISLLIICLFYLHYIPTKLAQFLAVYGSTSLICILSLQRSWRHVLRNPVQVGVIIFSLFATFILFLLSLG